MSPSTSTAEAELAVTKASGRGSWFRSVPFQIAVACGVSFTAPGMWDALGGLGAGGAAEPVSAVTELKTQHDFEVDFTQRRDIYMLIRNCSMRYQQPTQ